MPGVHLAISVIWSVLLAVWVILSITAKRSERRQSAGSRILHVALEILAFFLVFDPDLWIGVLARRIVPASASADLAGLAPVICGVGIAVWARFFLGRNWSAAVTVKQDHKLIRTGPYAIVRHPIYSGLALALLGTAITKGRLACFVGVVIAVIGWRVKSLVEEHFMSEQFGGEYTRYKKQVKALLPFIW